MTPSQNLDSQVLNTISRTRVQAPQLRWSCRPEDLPFASTEEIEPVAGVVGQDDALESLAFGLEINAPGQNIFVRGLSGTGRLSLVRRLVTQIRPQCPIARDRCYVHNFAQPDRPRLVSLPRGKGANFQRGVDSLIEFVRRDLPQVISSDALKARRQAIERRAQAELRKLTETFETELREAGLALVQVPAGANTQLMVLPVIEGNPTPIEQVDALVHQGQFAAEELERIKKEIEERSEQLEEVAERANEVSRRTRENLLSILEIELRSALKPHVFEIEREVDAGDAVSGFLEEVVKDVLHRFGRGPQESYAFTRAYRVNTVLTHTDSGCPVVAENLPTLQALVGTIELESRPGEPPVSDHTMIRGGALLAADGGFLVLDARDLLGEPGAWKALLRTLRTGRLEIGAVEQRSPWFAPSLKPDPIDIHVKVILIGDAEIYYALDEYEPDFAEQFKVLADFDTVIPRDDRGVGLYAGVLARIIQEEGLLPFECSAVAAIAEHGARIAAQNGKLTARFGRLSDIAREAAFLAAKASVPRVRGEDVQLAIQRTKRRGDLPARHFRQLVAAGTLHVQTRGWAVGQVNGLAVTHAGPLTYGFPARITAAIGPGTAGAINIEREANLSGAIHTKGFYILGGLLRHLLRTNHPLAFSASIAFEQSYGGIDGDSASGAEMCCLLSALTEMPLRQELAMTGAIDQLGHILPIGAANEKIEGFYDTCCDLGGLTGEQGVIIPASNVGDLMLRKDVVEACAAGRFHVHGVSTIQEALELFCEVPCGVRDEEGGYTEGSLLAKALEQVWIYWEKASGRHGVYWEEESEGAEGEETAEEEAGAQTAEENASEEA